MEKPFYSIWNVKRLLNSVSDLHSPHKGALHCFFCYFSTCFATSQLYSELISNITTSFQQVF